MNLMNQKRLDILGIDPIFGSFKFGIARDQPGKRVMILQLFGKME